MTELDVKYHGGKMVDFDAIRSEVTEKFSDQSQSDQAEKPIESAEPTENQSQENTQESKSQAQAILDLSKAEKFLIEGKEYTWDQLKKERLMSSDYTRKTQELANERRSWEEKTYYHENFKRDLPKVLQEPELMADVQRKYPKEFVEMFQTYLEMSPRQQQAVAQGMQIDPGTIRKYVEPLVKPLQDKIDNYEKQTLIKQLDASFSQMKGKYPNAEEEFVMSRLQALDNQNVEITDKKIEEVFKFFHDREAQKLDAYHKEQLKKQSEATAKAKDAPSGGGTPGQAPKKLKLGDVKGALMDHLTRQHS